MAKLKIVTDKKGTRITDGYLTDWIVFYDWNGTWACDGIFGFNKETIGKEICDTLDKMAIERMNKNINSLNEHLKG